MSAIKKDTKRKLPSGWRWIRLGEVIQNYQAGFACGERDVEGIVQLRMNNIDTRGNFIWDNVLRVPREGNQIESFLLVPGDVLFNNTNSTELVGKSALFAGYTEPIVYSNHFTRLRTISDALSPLFLSNWLNYQWNQGVFELICNRWIGQSAVKADKLLNLIIPLPPLSEQDRIADILREQLATVEKARVAAQYRLETIKSLPAAFLRQIFPAPGQPLPDGWRWIRLGDVVDVRDGTHDTPRYVSNGIPLITSKNLKPDGLDFKNALNISEEDHNQIRKRSGVSKGDILFAMIGTIGNPVIVETERQFSIKNVALFKFENSDVLNVFCYYLLLSPFISHQLEKDSQGGIQKFVSLTVFRNMQIPLPSQPEQQRIAQLLSEQMASVEKIRTAAEAELTTINALPVAFLRRAFNGEI